MSSSPGLPDAGAAGPRLAAGHPGSTAGPHRASPHPVLTTTDLWGHSATIPSLAPPALLPPAPPNWFLPWARAPSGLHFLRQLSGPRSSPEPSRWQAGLSVSGCAAPGWREDHRAAKRGQRRAGGVQQRATALGWLLDALSVHTPPGQELCPCSVACGSSCYPGWTGGEGCRPYRCQAWRGWPMPVGRVSPENSRPVSSSPDRVWDGSALSLQASGGGLWPSRSAAPQVWAHSRPGPTRLPQKSQD